MDRERLSSPPPPSVGRSCLIFPEQGRPADSAARPLISYNRPADGVEGRPSSIQGSPSARYSREDPFSSVSQRRT